MRTSIGNLSAVTVRTISDIRPVAEVLARRLSLLVDYRISPWHDIASRKPMIDADGNVLLVDVFGWPKDPKEQWWVRTSRSALDIISPVVAACRYESEPFWCNEKGFRADLPNPFIEQFNLDNFSARSTFRAAIVVPVHLPFGQIGVASLSPKNPELIDLSDDFEEHGAIIALHIRRFISSYVMVTSHARNEAFEPYRSLSRREIECLHWASLGKTNEDISKILGLSVSTIRFHIANASAKLSAITRGQAVAKAARLGYIKN